LQLNLEKTGSQQENWTKAEELGWTYSSDEWLEIRDLRDDLVLEWMDNPQTLLSALQIALDKTDLLIKTQSHFQHMIEKIIGQPHFSHLI
jgi:hypothetical protein